MDLENDSSSEDFAVVEKAMVTSSSNLSQKSLYGQVVFHDLSDIYPTDCDIKCRYSLAGEVSPQPGDKIALFKVGWLSVSEYISFEWAPLPSGSNQNVLQVTFKEGTLPKDEEDMYQLCYVTSGNVIAGASTPFGFRKPHESELVAIEDPGDPGLVVFRSGVTQVQQELNKVIEERDTLLDKCYEFEELVSKYKNSIDQMKELEIKHLKEIDDLKEQHKQAVAANEAIQEKMKKNPYESVILGLRNELSAAEKNVNSLNEQLRQKEEQLKTNELTNQCLMQDITRMEENLKENVKTVEALKKENTKLIEQAQTYQRSNKETAEESISLIKVLEASIEEKNDRIAQLSAQSEEYDRLTCIIKENENLIQELTEQLQAYSSSSIEETVFLKTEVDKLKRDLSKQEETNRGLEAEIKKLTSALNKIKKGSGDNWKPIVDTVTGLLNGLSGIPQPEDSHQRRDQPTTSTSDKLASVIQEKSDLRAEIIQVKHENQELNRVLADIREENAALKSRVGVLEVELRNTKAELSNASKSRESLDAQRLIEQFNANIQAVEKFNSLISERSVLEGILEQETGAKLSLQKKVEDLLRYNAILYGELQKAREERDGLKKEIQEWKNTLAGESITVLRSALDTLESEKRAVDEALASTVKDKEALEKQLMSLRMETVGKSTFMNKQLQQEIERLKAEVENKSCCQSSKEQLHQACVKYSNLYQILSSLPGLEVLYSSELLKPPAPSDEETLSARFCPICSLRLVTSMANFKLHVENHLS